MSPDDARHGTTRGFHAGCRDICCRRAIARYEKAGRLAKLQGGRAVPALGAQRRIQALMRMGWTSVDIAKTGGWHHRNAILRILKGQRGRPTTWLQRHTDTKVREIYEQMSMTPPESTMVRRRIAAMAERNGWPPPLAWDDIDDPSECPTDWAYIPATRHETFAELVDRGAGVSEVCRVLKLSRDSLQKWCARSGLSEEFRTIVGREFSYAENQFSEGVA